MTIAIDDSIYNNYKSYVIYINSRLTSHESLLDKLKDTMRYEAIMMAHHEKHIIKSAVYPWMALAVLIPALIIAKNKYKGLF